MNPFPVFPLELPWIEAGLIQRDPWIDPRFPNSSGYSAGKSISWYSEGTTSVENLDGRSRNVRTTGIPREKPESIHGPSRFLQEWDSIHGEGIFGIQLGSGASGIFLPCLEPAWSERSVIPEISPWLFPSFGNVEWKSGIHTGRGSCIQGEIPNSCGIVGLGHQGGAGEGSSQIPGIPTTPNPGNPVGLGDPSGNVGSGILGGRKRPRDPAPLGDGRDSQISRSWEEGRVGRGRSRNSIPLEHHRHRLHFPPFSQSFYFYPVPFPAWRAPEWEGQGKGRAGLLILWDGTGTGKGRDQEIAPAKKPLASPPFSPLSPTFSLGSWPFPFPAGLAGRGKGREWIPLENGRHHLRLPPFCPNFLFFIPSLPKPFGAGKSREK
ncbi:uncharacterized protein [Taeniopygia guttata]|uniref:uncharacterized protein n=1 Tax=Taeniopygia guttata TaxID=59729 RepID=UPI003BB96FD9